uniref:RNase H type-1 domain-containing protein n=1 Tax=Rhizophora mucronata TaxID=61149 RepID=A0A2P2IUB0_RHIMU
MSMTGAGESITVAGSRVVFDDDLKYLLSEQRRELVAMETLDSDLDLAFDLQLQEAMNASLSLMPSTSSSPPPQVQPPTERSRPIQKDAPSASFPTLQSEEISKLEKELNDRKQSEVVMRRMREDFDRRIHDQSVAREILRIPDHDWREWGDEFEKPFGEGCSGGGETNGENNILRLYFKGLVSEEKVRGEKATLAGIGVAICDPRGSLVFEISKPLIGNGMSKTAAECKALIEGLSAALALELKRIAVYCDHYPLYQFVSAFGLTSILALNLIDTYPINP